MIEVPATFRAQPRWWHDDTGRSWLEDLPGLVAVACDRWGLLPDGTALHGSNALVLPVTRDGVPFALRLAPPGDDVAREARALRWWAGAPVVGLHAVDVPGRAMLLERLDGSTTLASRPLAEVVEVAAGLMARLAVPAPDDVPTTASLAATDARELLPTWERLGRPVEARHMEAAAEAAATLAVAPVGTTAVDGDLHPRQVLAGTREPWLVVDPVLLRGDPEHDLARLLLPFARSAGAAELRAAVSDVARTTGVPAERASAWVAVRAASYLLWGIEHGLTIDPPLSALLLAAVVPDL